MEVVVVGGVVVVVVSTVVVVVAAVVVVVASVVVVVGATVVVVASVVVVEATVVVVSFALRCNVGDGPLLPPTAAAAMPTVDVNNAAATHTENLPRFLNMKSPFGSYGASFATF